MQTEEYSFQQYEHEHSHGHKHRHDDEYVCKVMVGKTIVSVHAYSHEEASVASCEFWICSQFDFLHDVIDSILQETAIAIESNGGLVGHIKAMIESEDRTCRLSVTDGPGNNSKMKHEECSVPTNEPNIRVRIAGIGFGISPQELAEIMGDLLRQLS